MKGIYSITCTIHHRQYIGSAVNLHSRKMHHFHRLRANAHANKKLQRAFNKYGSECFIFSVLEEVEDASNLINREQFYIDTLKPFYNICKVAGSPLGIKRSALTREKLSIIAKGRDFSEETRRKMSIARSKMKHTNETRAKMSSSQKGKIISKESRDKLSIIAKNRIFSPETRAKMAANMRRRLTPEFRKFISTSVSASLKNRKKSAEHCSKVSMAKKKLFATNKIQRRADGTFLKGVSYNSQ